MTRKAGLGGGIEMEEKKEIGNLLIKRQAIETGKILGYEYRIVPCPASKGFNGYAVFPKKPVREQGYEGILVYVPVHGGITYCSHDKAGSVYGFDTAHCDSDRFPIHNMQWIKKQIEIMIKGILKAKEVEAKYLRCLTNKGKAKYAQQVADVAPKQWYNFGVAINLLGGKL